MATSSKETYTLPFTLVSLTACKTINGRFKVYTHFSFKYSGAGFGLISFNDKIAAKDCGTNTAPSFVMASSRQLLSSNLTLYPFTHAYLLPEKTAILFFILAIATDLAERV